jgi:hypothetical protein
LATAAAPPADPVLVDAPVELELAVPVEVDPVVVVVLAAGAELVLELLLLLLLLPQPAKSAPPTATIATSDHSLWVMGPPWMCSCRHGNGSTYRRAVCGVAVATAPRRRVTRP